MIMPFHRTDKNDMLTHIALWQGSKRKLIYGPKVIEMSKILLQFIKVDLVNFKLARTSCCQISWPLCGCMSLKRFQCLWTEKEGRYGLPVCSFLPRRRPNTMPTRLLAPSSPHQEYIPMVVTSDRT
ncbi:hypothetical protein HZ326_5635 [Fusarium oxysporum f. sp. albedinis]|nr:hypothetical protein HZ326_5635 [Fusarium oxysporum f. sp. albedinis]